MDENLEKEIQDSLEDRAGLEEKLAERDKKDRKIIDKFCSLYDYADLYHTLELLEKYKGMSPNNKKTVNEFKQNYPDNLTVKLISEFFDVVDLYSKYLESGGEG